MKKQGFTLIELMIVVAVLGIAFQFLYPGLEIMIFQDQLQHKILQDSAGLTRLYGLITTELRQCGEVEYADEKGVSFVGGRSLKVFDSGKTIQVGLKRIKLEGHARFWGFERIDARTFSSQIKNGGEEFRAIWRTGND